ncbi:hypothetical protein DF186_19820, partial [Enterococcus hirae]
MFVDVVSLVVDCWVKEDSDLFDWLLCVDGYYVVWVCGSVVLLLVGSDKLFVIFDVMLGLFYVFDMVEIVGFVEIGLWE